jgi:predicted TIM-barrel fold metal-dependent hydrolase
MPAAGDTISPSAQIHDQIDHPVVDGDGHWLESYPVFFDYVHEVGGPKDVDAFRRSGLGQEGGHGTTIAERRAGRIPAPPTWSVATVGNDHDWATAMLPELMYRRLDEFGIDVMIMYPTLGLRGINLAEPHLRAVFCRAYNRMVLDLFAPYRDRIVPVAVIPTHTPDEAIEELGLCVAEGFKASMINGTIRRPKGGGADGGEVLAQGSSYIDVLALDSPFDYEGLWAAFEEAGMAITVHGGAWDWDGRQSISNFSFNHIGHFAQANQAFARGLFLGGVPRRHPDLRFVFLEGGVAWGANLLSDLISHWARRARAVMLERYVPDRLDVEGTRALIRRYGASSLGPHVEEMCADDMLQPLRPHNTLATLTETVQGFDFDLVGIESEAAFRRVFTRSFFFGCEAEDPMTRVAFDDKLLGGIQLKPVFSSDVSHSDVKDMRDVLHEAYELVDRGLLDEQAFRSFTFSNAVLAHTALNAAFFDGTIIEKEARTEASRHHVGDPEP